MLSSFHILSSKLTQGRITYVLPDKYAAQSARYSFPKKGHAMLFNADFLINLVSNQPMVFCLGHSSLWKRLQLQPIFLYVQQFNMVYYPSEL